MPYVLTPLAKADVFDIWSYIADDNEDTADRVEQAIYDACAFVAEGPSRGHTRPDLTMRPVRFWTLTRYPNYSVVYGQRRPRLRSSPFCTEGEIFGAS
jgi:plasmid stabilization system protein ParE